MAMTHRPRELPPESLKVKYAGQRVRFLSLGRSRFAVIDAADGGLAGEKPWRCYRGYAVRTVRVDGKVGAELLHRVLLGNPPRALFVDHINRDPLDNRRCNLRLATPAESARNRGPWRGLKIKGARPYKGKFVARIGINGKRIQVGTFATEIEAVRAYDAAARKYHGEFAHLNLGGA